MSFIKGFVTTIIIYFAASLAFAVTFLVIDPVTPYLIVDAFTALFSGIEPIGQLFYGNLAIPTVNLAFSELVAIFSTKDLMHLLTMLSYILPPALASILGAVVAKKSGRVKSIFGAIFGGLLVCSVIGIILQVVVWPTAGLIYGTSFYLNWEWFLPATLIMTAFNAFFWSSVGLLLTSKTWD
jgi:hypothetical protein